MQVTVWKHQDKSIGRRYEHVSTTLQALADASIERHVLLDHFNPVQAKFSKSAQASYAMWQP